MSIERLRLLPHDKFGIYVNTTNNSKEVGEIFKKYYPDSKHTMAWNANDSFYCLVNNIISCHQTDIRDNCIMYTLDQFKQFIADSDKPKEEIINTYSIY